MEEIIYSLEAVAGFELVKLVPKDKLLKQWNAPVLGAVVIAAGVMAPKAVGSHLTALGIGAFAEGVLSLVGL